MQAGVPLRPILLLVALISLSQAVSCLRGLFVVGFLVVLVGWVFLLLAPSSSAKAALQILHSPFETHLVKGQKFCGTWTTSSTSSSGDGCYFSWALWNLLLFVTLLPLTNTTAHLELAGPLLPQLSYHSLTLKTAAAAFMYSGLCLAYTKGKNTNPKPTPSCTKLKNWDCPK